VYGACVTDFELMKLAKKRVRRKSVFRWHIRLYFVAGVLLTGLYLFTDSGGYWPVLSVLSWGPLVAFHGINVDTLLSSSCPLVADEYSRLKRLSIIKKQQSGE